MIFETLLENIPRAMLGSVAKIATARQEVVRVSNLIRCSFVVDITELRKHKWYLKLPTSLMRLPLQPQPMLRLRKL